MFRRLPTPLIIYFSLVLGCGASLSTSSLADYFETPRYSGDVQPISSGDKILIAGTDSDSHEAKSLIQLLDTYNLEYKLYTHPPLFTVEDSKKMRGKIKGAHTKNLFLKCKNQIYFF